MKFRIKFTLLIISLLFSSSLFAYEMREQKADESSDFTTRVGFDIKRKLYKDFSLTWAEEVRFKTFSSKFDRLYSSLSFNYSVNKYFKTALGYTYMLIGSSNTLNHRHRLHLDVEGSYSVKQWKFSLRERPEFLVKIGSFDPLKTSNPSWELRSRITAEYSVRNKPLRPRLAFELFNTLNAPRFAKGNYISRIRNEVGLKWSVADLHTLNFYYRFDVDNARNISVDYIADVVNIVNLEYKRTYKHILGVAYTFDWR